MSVGKTLMNLYFKENSLVKQQIDSFNRFVDHGLSNVIQQVGMIKTNVENFEIKLGKIRVEPPRFYEIRGGYRQILPSEARSRNATYASPIFLEMTPVMGGVEKPIPADVFIGELPVMIKSKLCSLSTMSREELIENGEDPDDPGGYFIINGSERALISIEDIVPNKLITTKETKGILAKVFSTKAGFRARCALTRSNEGLYTVEFPSSPRNTPLIQLLRILGLEDKEIVGNVDPTTKRDLLINIEVEESKDKESALELFSKKLAPGQPAEYRVLRVENVLNNYLLPHIGTEKRDRTKKAQYLLRMARNATFVACKKLVPDDKDHYANKRIKLAGDLMQDLFRYAFQFLTRDIIYQAGRAEARGRKLQVYTLIRQDALSDRMRYAMATGNWIAGQTGVCQLLDRISFLSMLSHLRRVLSPLAKKHPHFEARDLHGTHFGRLCPTETPEGPSCSLVKNLALFTDLTIGCDEAEIEKVLKTMVTKNE